MKSDPLKTVNQHFVTVRRVAWLIHIVKALSFRSYRFREGFRHLFGGWAPYALSDQSLAVHDSGRRYFEGKKRLLLVTNELSMSGGPRIVGEIAKIFARSEWFVTVVSPMDGPFRDAIQPHASIIIDPTVLDQNSPLIRRLRTVSDLAICNTVLTDAAILGLAKQVPTLWYLHEVSLLSELLETRPQTMRALAEAHQVWAGSDLSASLARPYRQDVRVQPYGVVAPVCAPSVSIANRPDTELPAPIRISVFGSVESRKGQDLAVAALAALSVEERSTIRLTLFGRVLDQRFADSVAVVASTMPEVSWGGELNSTEYVAALAATDVVLVSSRDDTLPLVSLDALGSGRLLMCTPGTGTSAWLKDGESGFVAADTEVGEIAAMLSRALARRNHWPKIIEAGKEVFDLSFSADAFASTLRVTADDLLHTAHHG